ncbi:MAG: hypothetical protein IKH30_06395 [Clostridia bacterium]|nr:hypothetical protein [Clostridia bacterium]
MSNVYHPAVYSQLIILRQALAQAFEQKDLLRVPALAAQIDRLQLDCWSAGIIQSAS